MNILFIGGNHKLCIELIYKLLEHKTKYNIVVLDNQRNIYKENETINYHFEYLKGDIFNYYYGNIENKEFIYKLCLKHNINIIINNVKYSVYKTFEENYISQINGNYNIFSISQELKINKIINITHNFSNNFFHLKNYKKLISHISFFDNYINNLSSLMGLSDIFYNIIYYDNLIYNNYEFSNTILDKYVYSFKIGDKPYIYNMNMCFINSENIINTLIKCLNNNNFYITYCIYGSKINIQSELIPTIINHIKYYDSKIICSYYTHNNEECETKPVKIGEINKAIGHSVKNIFK